MKTSRSLLRSALVLAALSPIASACAHTPPPEARAAAPQPVVAPVAETVVQAPVVATPSAIVISDDLRKACGINDGDAHFAFDSSHLEAADISPLNQVATCLLSGPLRGKSIKLLGRADPRGPDEYNMTLGQSRADSVGKYLGAKGVESARRPATSRGSMDAQGTDETSWKEDRRVDLSLGE